MDLLLNQETFEGLIGKVDADMLPELCVIWFTAGWCGPCRRLRMTDIMASVPSSVHWYKCDVDQNNYTAGYCNIRKIPAFMVIYRQKILGSLVESDTDKLIAWLQTIVPRSK